MISNRSKCVFLQNRHTDSNFVDVNKIGNQTLCKLFVDVNKSISEKTNDIQAKNNALSLLPINIFQEFQAIIKRISEQTKKPQA